MRGVTDLRAWQACDVYKKAIYKLIDSGVYGNDWKRRVQIEASVSGPPDHIASRQERLAKRGDRTTLHEPEPDRPDPDGGTPNREPGTRNPEPENPERNLNLNTNREERTQKSEPPLCHAIIGKALST